ncbi:MAG TPA: 50S ribosomal protein L6 [Bacteroidales bacterium]|jgi:large subunit ribosomal protein L6|nr:MAG: 50S ribosomal protein L6 [Bacteroidetes bacterium ADurb.Bin012]HNQ59230.1 50S ribosomal protein L6 [Bacteroidales bacterium]HNU20911.1 50S ribosomal protein L6 [Bacteroidales bacterium]HNV16342.1 50S ribosomal protein L6 [Bacteroidales bacterium]HOC14975.1 50S ribosomal protein L6 [Bacteroidales bacterium]
MSRIGKKPIEIPSGVKVSLSPDHFITVQGKLGELCQKIDPAIKVNIEGGEIRLEIDNPDDKNLRAKHGLYRSLINNMVIGVYEGFTIQQEIVGVGYKVAVSGQLLEFSLGYSHSLFLELPPEIKAEAVTVRGKNPILILKSHDKQLLGMVARKIRSFRPPEPYKGKGIRFVGEVVRRKAGKSASSK